MHLLLALASLTSLVTAANITQITNFGPNPTNVTFYLYLPDSFVSPNTSHTHPSPLLVYPHWCHGSALDAYTQKPWANISSELAFPVIFPSTPWTVDSCWDVSSLETLHHDAGGDSLGIASMVRWVLKKYEGRVDEERVFVTGVSSGGMMTNVLVAAYPELFAAGSIFAGVPYGCFASGKSVADGGADVWSDACAAGNITHSGPAWASLVHDAYPSYKGVRPKMQIFHGTADETLNVQNYYEEVKMWTSVLGVSPHATEVHDDTPEDGWTEHVFGKGRRKGLVEATLADGVTHDIPDQVDEVIRFFELDCVGRDCFSRRTLEKLEKGRGR